MDRPLIVVPDDEDSSEFKDTLMIVTDNDDEENSSQKNLICSTNREKEQIVCSPPSASTINIGKKRKRTSSRPKQIQFPRVEPINIDQTIIDERLRNLRDSFRLIVQVKKIYRTRQIQIFAHLFPSCFSPPDYRCIHCFLCDQFLSPNEFVNHNDEDETVSKTGKEKLLSVSPMKLLRSESFSDQKIVA